MDNAKEQKAPFKTRFFNLIGKTAFKDTKMYQKKAAALTGTAKKKNKKQAPTKTYEKRFTVIIPVYNVKQYLAEAIESVINQTVGFVKTVQLILIDDGSTDGSDFVCRKYSYKYPDNIVYRATENRGVSAARNLGIDLAVGKYIAFLDGDDHYAKNSLEECWKFMEKHHEEIDLLFTDMEYFEARQGKHPLCKDIKTNSVISLDDGIVSSFSSCAAFFKAEVFENLKFDEKMVLNEDVKLVSLAMKNKRAFGHLANVTYWCRKRNTKESASDGAGKKDNVNMYKCATDCHRYMIDDDLKNFGHVTKFTQKGVTYNLSWYRAKSSTEVLSSLEYQKACDALLYCLNNIDDAIILSNKHANYWIKLYQLMLKHGEPRIAENEIEPRFFIGNVSFAINIAPSIFISEEKDGLIHFGGYYNTPFPDLVELVVRYNGKEYTARYCESQYEARQIYYFGKKILSATQFDIHIPYERDGYMEFFMRTKAGRRTKCDVEYASMSRLNNNLPCSQFFLGEDTILTKIGSNTVLVKKFDYATMEYMLAEASCGYLKMHTEIIEEYIRCYKEFSGRRIWVFYDRLDQNNDNAYWLYNYAKQFNDGIEKYYLISKRARNWKNLFKDRNVLDYDNIKNRVILFFCEKFISSQTIREVLSYAPKESRFGAHYDIFRTLFRADEIFLQHGITQTNVDNIYSYFNRNFNMFVTAVKSEYEYILGEQFSYPPEVVKLTGFPRYDYLNDKAEKIIIFAPTWDKRFMSAQEGYNPAFKCSNKYSFIQAFINNERLCKELRKSGYKIYCKLHPGYLRQMSDFYTEYGDVIKFAGDEITYNKIFEIGALFVTDYSSAVFDFAYLKKPVLYYQELGLHHSLDGSYFSFEENGFGKISYDFETLIDDVIECVKGGCKMPEKYQKRVDDFFTFRDKNNCKRVYDEILKLPVRKFAQPSEPAQSLVSKQASKPKQAAKNPAKKSSTTKAKTSKGKATTKTKNMKGDKKNGKK